MNLFDNKPMTILVVVNLIALMVIFWLIGLLMGRESTPAQPVVYQQPAPVQTPVQAPVASGTPQATQQAPLTQQAVKQVSQPVRANQAESLQQRAASIVGEMKFTEAQAATELGAAVNPQTTPEPEPEPVMVERVTTIDVFYDGTIAQIETTDGSGNRSISISNNLKEVQKLSEEDAAYMEQYRKMRSGQIGHMQITQITQEEARSIQASEETGITEVPIDYFNKVDVSKKTNSQASLASQVAMIVNAETSTKRSRKQREADENEAYIASLETESAERKNETRTIKVKFGDSLWKIAERAYGSGFEFPKIYAANPHLKNPDMIRVGETLRVPL